MRYKSNASIGSIPSLPQPMSSGSASEILPVISGALTFGQAGVAAAESCRLAEGDHSQDAVRGATGQDAQLVTAAVEHGLRCHGVLRGAIYVGCIAIWWWLT